MKDLSFLFLLLISFSALSQTDKSIKAVKDFNETAMPRSNRHAFIIGVDNYEDKHINPLFSCRNDANRMYSLLVSPRMGSLDFSRIRLHLDETGDSVKNSLRSFLNEIRNPQTVTLYFYFSGHGEKEGLVLRDSRLGEASSFIEYSWLTKILNDYKIGMTVLVIDACRSGSAREYLKSNSTFLAEFDKFFTKSKKTNFILFAASRPDKNTRAGENTSKVSQYTAYFWEAVMNASADENGDALITSGELAIYLEKKLKDINPPEFAGPENFPIANLATNDWGEPQPGFKDSDGDGIIDSKDDCPYEVGYFEYKGCKTKKLVINEFMDERDGQVYSYVNINGTLWMNEDLRYKAHGSLAFYNSGDTGSQFYTRANILRGKICPEGWKIPKAKDLGRLYSYLINQQNLQNPISFKFNIGLGGYYKDRPQWQFHQNSYQFAFRRTRFFDVDATGVSEIILDQVDNRDYFKFDISYFEGYPRIAVRCRCVKKEVSE